MKTENTDTSISVVIPCHNSEGTIKRTLNAVLNQSFPCHEIITVDNNSAPDDKTAAVIASLDNPKIKYLAPENCANGNQARNIGSEEAVGNFIAYCDSDDEWDSDHLDARIRLLQNNKIAAIYGGANVVNGQKSKLIISRPICSEESPVEFLIGVNKGFAQTSSFFIEKSVWQTCPWDESLKRHQDYEFFINIQKIFGWHYLDHATYTIYWHGSDIRNHHFQSYWSFYEKHRPELSEPSRAKYLFTRWKEAILFSKNREIVERFSVELAKYRSELDFPKKLFFCQPWLLKLLWPLLRHYL